MSSKPMTGRFGDGLENRLPDAFTNAIGTLEHLGREGVAEHLQAVATSWFTELKKLRAAAPALLYSGGPAADGPRIRQQFEVWAKASGLSLQKVAVCYVDDLTQNAYLGWKACAALVAAPVSTSLGGPTSEDFDPSNEVKEWLEGIDAVLIKLNKHKNSALGSLIASEYSNELVEFAQWAYCFLEHRLAKSRATRPAPASSTTGGAPNYKGLTEFYLIENGLVKSYFYVAQCKAENYHILKEQSGELPRRFHRDQLDKMCSTEQAAWAMLALALEDDMRHIKDTILPQFTAALPPHEQ